MPSALPVSPLAFEEAVRWFRSHTVLTKDQWLRLSERARRRAFTAAAVARADVLLDVHKALSKALDKGTALAEFKRDVGQKLRDSWQGTVKNPAWRIETIYRTNLQGAYGAGRWQQISEPALKRLRPWAMFDAIMDGRTTARCESLDGKIRPMEEFERSGLIPPLHFACRSTIRSLREKEAQRRGIADRLPSGVSAQKGFGLPAQADEWKPDLGKYPPEIREKVARELKTRPGSGEGRSAKALARPS